MKPIKFKLFALVVSMLFVTTAGYGQAVYYDKDEGGIVIDCSMMPSESILTESMEEEDNQLPDHYSDEPANRVYYKLVLAMSDVSESTYLGKIAAGTAAAEATTDGKSDWRLPNQRELMLIWVLYDYIKDAATTQGATFQELKADAYTSSTTGLDCYYPVYLNFASGIVYEDAISISSYARAVREIK